jgi:uncharacterized membrane protein (UPF0136 family)
LQSVVAFSSSWSDLLLGLQKAWAEQPVLFVLAAPCLVALAARSLTALTISGLLAAAGLASLGTGLDEAHRWGIALAICCSGLLVAVQAFLFRRTRKRLRKVSADFQSAANELGEVREKYLDEVRWRKAVASFAAATKRDPRLATLPSAKPLANLADG